MLRLITRGFMSSQFQFQDYVTDKISLQAFVKTLLLGIKVKQRT